MPRLQEAVAEPIEERWFELSTHEGRPVPMTGRGRIPPERRIALNGLSFKLSKIEWLSMQPHAVAADAVDIRDALLRSEKPDEALWWDGYASAFDDGIPGHDPAINRTVYFPYHSGREIEPPEAELGQ